jgi:hypothetical protein
MAFLKGLTKFFHFEQEPQTVQPEQQMTRRGLLMGLGASLVVAAMPQIPFGRVWSIPKKIVCRQPLWNTQVVALQLEDVNDMLPTLVENDDVLFNMIAADDFGHADVMIRKLRRKQAQNAAFWRGDQFLDLSGPEWDNAAYVR